MTGPSVVSGVFESTGPLPEGAHTVVLEASAGTGKTHAISGMATRYVADGLALDRLMLVTFGRAATHELRERVRERMSVAAVALRDQPAAATHPDDVVRLLAAGPVDVVDLRLRRLVTALAQFDAATIATTHGFCGQMLRALGVVADVDHDARLVESTTDLVEETVNDLYVRAFGQSGSQQPLFGFDLAERIAKVAADDPSAQLGPDSTDEGSEPYRRRRLAQVVREEWRRRKRRGRVQDYDDLLLELARALSDPVSGSQARDRIRSRFDVVMVDEFQDTDPVQWEILERVFHDHTTLVLIGDPKQAIYAFRGADVHAYLRAGVAAHERRTLAVNYRSDQRLVDALDLVLGGRALGDPRITVGPVRAHRPESRLGPATDGRPSAAPFRLRVVDRTHVPPAPGKPNPQAGPVQRYVARDVAADIARLLASATVIDGRQVAAGDVAVLVQTGNQAQLVKEALSAVGVPAVLTGTASVFAGDAARHWVTLLTALEQPHRPGLVRAAALTPFVGWSAAELASASDAALDAHAARLRGWADVLRGHGVAALLEVATMSADGAARMLAREGGERLLTDLRHIGQMLHVEMSRRELGPTGLLGWLRQRMADAAADTDRERSRRLESDADAVQVTTVHTSKGLEYPIVYAPYLWWRMEPFGAEQVLLYHDADGRRVRDVGGPHAPGYDERRELHDREAVDESLRLAYVALTRAGCQVVTWWAPTWNTQRAPLHRLLFCTPADDGTLPLRVPLRDDASVRAALDDLAAGSGGLVAVESAELDIGVRWEPPSAAPADLVLRRLGRPLDLDWVRTSYSRLTAGLHEVGPGVGSEAESPGTVDEPQLEHLTEVAPADALPSPMAGLPVGAAFGTLVHSVLEALDFTAPDLRAALVARSAAESSQRLAGVPPEELADALLPPLRTPLGPLAAGRRLADFAPADVLAEMEYEYPLAGGDRPGPAHATVDQIGELLARHLRNDDPLRAYADDLTADSLRGRPLRGFIGGFLDAVLRVRADDGTPSYLVVDYKSNWLGGAESLTSWDYRPESLVRAMREAHYPLQALLYAVAVHRFLRWRQPGYDPDTHLGGVLYLFLRGMCGPETPAVGGVPAGVFSWRPPGALVTDLSDLLDRGELGGAR